MSTWITYILFIGVSMVKIYLSKEGYEKYLEELEIIKKKIEKIVLL